MSAPLHTSRRIVCEACPLCGASSWHAFVGAETSAFEWVRCDCGAVFKRAETAAGDDGDATRPSAVSSHQTTGEPSGSVQRARGAGPSHYDDAYFDRYARRRRRRIAKSRRQILDALEVAPPGPLLEIGCSLGYTLEAARALGLEASGVDLSVHAVDGCRRLGLDARVGSMEALPFENTTFAVAVLKHVFEHTATPRAALAELRRVLVPGAAVFFAVPNLDYFRAARWPQTSRFFRGEAAAAHQVYYSPATLARVVEEAGFCVAGVHPALLHRRAGVRRTMVDALLLPLRLPAGVLANALGLRKEFWLVAVRT